MKILKWLKDLFKRKSNIQIIIKDDLSPLDLRINVRGEPVTKTINRTLIQFVRHEKEYQVFLIMQGHEFVIDRWYLMSDKLPLMVIKESDLHKTIESFQGYDHHIIEVKES